jgi:periplasmic copper chaperone A
MNTHARFTTNHTPTTSKRLRPHRWLAAAAAAVLLALSLAGCGEAEGASASDGGGTITIEDGWVRATAGTDDPTMSAAFMVINNGTDKDVALTAAASPVAGMVQLHEMVMADGDMVMQEVADGITVAAGRGKVLEPGGFHVMLMDVQQELAPGDEAEVTLTFSDGSTQTLTLPVKEFTEEEGHHHEPGTEEHGHDADDGSMDEMDMEETG